MSVISFPAQNILIEALFTQPWQPFFFFDSHKQNRSQSWALGPQLCFLGKKQKKTKMFQRPLVWWERGTCLCAVTWELFHWVHVFYCTLKGGKMAAGVHLWHAQVMAILTLNNLHLVQENKKRSFREQQTAPSPHSHLQQNKWEKMTHIYIFFPPAKTPNVSLRPLRRQSQGSLGQNPSWSLLAYR